MVGGEVKLYLMGYLVVMWCLVDLRFMVGFGVFILVGFGVEYDMIYLIFGMI